MNHHHLWGILACAAPLFVATSDAYACSCAGTEPVIYTADGDVPADLGGIAVWEGNRGFDSVAQPFVEIERWVDGSWVEEKAPLEQGVHPFGFEPGKTLAFFRPQPFAEGDRFRVTAGYDTGYPDSVVTEVEVVAPLPTISGQPTLTISEQVDTTVQVSMNTSCYTHPWSATRRLDIQLPTELEPYRELLLYETTIDGEPWRPATDMCAPNPVGRSWRDDPGTDLLAAACEYPLSDHEPILLDEGEFEVQMHAFFPATTEPVWSTPATNVTLDCPATCVEYDYRVEEFVPCTATEDAGHAERGSGGPDGGDVDGDTGGAPSVEGCATATRYPGLLPVFLFALFAFSRRVVGHTSAGSHA